MPLLLEVKIREWAKYSQMSTVFVSFWKRDRGLPDFKRAHKNYFSWAFLFFWPLLTLFAGAILDATITLVNKKKHCLLVKKFKLDWNIMLINHYSSHGGFLSGSIFLLKYLFYIDISIKIVIMLFKPKKSYSCNFYRIKFFFLRILLKLKKFGPFQ